MYFWKELIWMEENRVMESWEGNFEVICDWEVRSAIRMLLEFIFSVIICIELEVELVSRELKMLNEVLITGSTLFRFCFFSFNFKQLCSDFELVETVSGCFTFGTHQYFFILLTWPSELISVSIWSFKVGELLDWTFAGELCRHSWHGQSPRNSQISKMFLTNL